MAKIIDLDIVLPLIVEPVQPNLVEVGTPEIISVGYSSIEVSQSFQCNVDYVGGIVCDTDPQATVATFRNNPGTIVQSISGLQQDTDYYIKGAGLPVLGNFTYGEYVKVHTSANPIPPEYQLVEYILSDGQARLDLGMRLTDQSITWIDCEQTSQPSHIFYGYMLGSDNTDYRLFGQYFDIYNGRITGIQYSGRHLFELGNFYIKRDGVLIGSGATQSFTSTTHNIYLFGIPGYGNSVGGYVFNLKIDNAVSGKNYNFYPVVRKADNMTGLYDIINATFIYDSHLLPGPDKEWEE